MTDRQTDRQTDDGQKVSLYPLRMRAGVITVTLWK